MKILIIPSWYKTKENPYSGTFFEEQARMLMQEGHEISILYPNHVPSFKTFIKNPFFSYSKENDNGLITYYSNTKSVIPTNWGNYFNIKLIKRHTHKLFKAYIKEFGKPDILHAHSVFFGGIVAKSLSKKHNIPFVITEHLSSLINSSEFNSFPFQKEIINVYNTTSKIIAVSSFLKEELTNKYYLEKTKSIIIPNLVKNIFFEESKLSKYTNEFKILNIGKLDSNKNQQLIIKALKILNTKYNLNIKLTIIGNGLELKNLKQLANKLNLEEKIKFLSPMSRTDIKTKIQQHHLLVSSSIFETFGLSLAEAHAVGIPTIALDSGGVRDIITQNNGIIIRENNPEAFAESIIKVYNNYSNYNSELIRKECYNKFSEKMISQALLEIYSEII